MRGKKAWVVTDWINGACGMERKETTEALQVLRCIELS